MLLKRADLYAALDADLAELDLAKPELAKLDAVALDAAALAQAETNNGHSAPATSVSAKKAPVNIASVNPASVKSTPAEMTPTDIDRVIEMAWEDRTPFEAIALQFGLHQDGVIKLMRSQLKAGSFKLWRARTRGQKTKHLKLRSTEVVRHQSQEHNKLNRV